jgi:hypothetical protein
MARSQVAAHSAGGCGERGLAELPTLFEDVRRNLSQPSKRSAVAACRAPTEAKHAGAGDHSDRNIGRRD